MSKKKRLNPQPAALPVLHGRAFTTFIEEAMSLGNEVTVRRAYDADVAEYLKQKGLLEEWDAWRKAKHAQS